MLYFAPKSIIGSKSSRLYQLYTTIISCVSHLWAKQECFHCPIKAKAIRHSYFMATVAYAMRLLVVMLFASTAPAVAQSTDDSLRVYAVNVGNLYGVYLGNDLIITAAHVVSDRVRVAGLDLPAKIIKISSYEELDLALLSVDAQKLPVSQRLRRMPLCQRPPIVGAAVIVAIPEGTARSRIMSPKLLPADTRTKFPTVISDVATTGNSGSGVFDAASKCLLGIMSRKIVGRSDSTGETRDLAKYFVPASIIRNFIPPEYRF